MGGAAIVFAQVGRRKSRWSQVWEGALLTEPTERVRFQCICVTMCEKRGGWHDGKSHSMRKTECSTGRREGYEDCAGRHAQHTSRRGGNFGGILRPFLTLHV
eukprot:1352964-Rhodomonas_salina.1